MRVNHQLKKDQISNVLELHFGINSKIIENLPLGNDPSASIYRIIDHSNQTYFLKLNRNEVTKQGIQVPFYLYSHGIDAVIPPIVNKKEELWFSENGFTWVLYPFVQSYDGYKVEFSSFQWSSFGESLSKIHAVSLPEDLHQSLPRESFKSISCERVKEYDVKMKNTTFNDPESAKLADFWNEKRNEIQQLIHNTDQIGRKVRTETFNFVLCHADLHPGNTVIDEEGNLIIVDWDSPILAPKERDLMFIGGGHRFKNPDIDAFYSAYGKLIPNFELISYYRNERILADIAVTADEMFENKGMKEEREIGLYLLMRQFEPNKEVDVALASLS
ncbi:phosphotransferase [Bacillus sp. NEB1478]|uniref:phosphotransferase n=1 Tax=Bacillus sp. NEB1478 TaxID=3073816 RepID=UPI002872FD09|nr:phosphotransferase [Bacillus sp. NEB1478]WNB93356.1 phosphotransferase [Bacillus sp. NEB1478]